ncbi:MAG: hypothetical protein JWO33_2563 [Caulobacteraceae bacterium]|nr:hypothetical protein [Caulobacteraceae bacterium]
MGWEMGRGTTGSAKAWAWLFGTVLIGLTGGSTFAYGQVMSPEAAREAKMSPSSAKALSGPARGLFVTPTLLVQESYTDNVAFTAGQRRSDLITRATLGLDAGVERGRATGKLSLDVFYDHYARRSQLSGWSAAGEAQGSFWLLKDRLSLVAEGTVTNGYTSAFTVSALDRSGVPGRTQLTVFFVGPRFTARLGEFADLSTAARYGQVSYDAGASSEVGALPADDRIAQAAARLDTGDRSRRLQLITNAQFDDDSQGYRAWNAVQSAYLTLTRGIRLILRGGYEQTRQNGVVNIGSPQFSAGLELRPRAGLRFNVEAGRRFERTTFAASGEWALSPRTIIWARHAESLTPAQIYIANAFTDYLTDQALLGTLPTPIRLSFNENLYYQTSYNKRSELHLRHEGPSQSFEVSGEFSDRRFLNTDTRDRFALGAVAVTRHVRPDIDVGVRGEYTRTFASPRYGRNDTYQVEGRVTYALNSSTRFDAEYHHKHGSQHFVGGEKITENVFLVALRKRF